MTSSEMGFHKNHIKRPADFTIAFLGLLVFSPLMVLIGLWLSIVNKGSPFFFQNRPGKGAREFRLVKFKTMADRYDSSGKLLPDRDRITRAGRFVRSASLDELPQLINVLKGDMSLIGPRPLLMDYLPLYSPEQARRHEVRPGITGWAQVNGRNAISWNQKFKLDVWYVDNIKLSLDLKILFITLKKVLVREGINRSGQKTAEPFNGSN